VAEATVAAIEPAFHAPRWTAVIYCVHPENTYFAAHAELTGARLAAQERLPPPADTSRRRILGQSHSDGEIAQSGCVGCKSAGTLLALKIRGLPIGDTFATPA
jgi:hypothetical protein